MTFQPAYWSPSRFAAWDECPARFYEQYVLQQPMEPNLPMHFGTAVHRGLEAHFRGDDGDLAFRRAWRELAQELRAAGITVSGSLVETGMRLIEQVVSLGLSGEPERKIWVRTDSYLGAPILGYADLWCPDAHEIFDFKTTVGKWSAERAEQEMHQPCAYSMAYHEQYGVLPTFEYIVLNRVDGSMQRFKTQRNADQIADWLARCRTIVEAIRLEQFDCCCPRQRHWQAAA